MNQIKVGIIGGTGYTGVELLRLLLVHPDVDVQIVTSRSAAGQAVTEMFPGLRGFTNLKFSQPSVKALQQCDLVFSATPNGVAMQHASELLEHGVKIIDLSADFRLADVAEWERWYDMQHACPQLIEQAVYGLPELNREQIKNANIVANPGCYPTATTLGFLPLIRARLVNCDNLIADTKSGVTGAGKTLSEAFLYGEVSDSFKAYAVSGHRHQPEINANLATIADDKVSLTFVPHLLPMLRGIHATLYADLVDQQTPIEKIQSVFEETYADEPFVDVMPSGSHPDTRSVRSSNMCRIAVHSAVGSGKIVVLSVIDNLTKGAAGQAVQNMNIMFELPEQTGLTAPAVTP